MGLRFDPMGGGQFKQAVQAIIEAERVPIKNLENRKKIEEGKMKLFQEFKSKFSSIDKTLDEFTNFRKFRELKADIGDGTNYLGITLDKDIAEPGSWQLQIDQLAERTSVMSNGFENPDEKILGIGFIIAHMLDGTVHEIYVDPENSSLKGVASLINRQIDSPFRAAVIKDVGDVEKPWKLLLSAKKDGADDALYFPEFYFLDGKTDIYLDQEHEASNALVKIDGFAVEAESNELKDFLPGVNLHLKRANPDVPFTLNIVEDYQKISGKLKTLIEQVNGILEWINKQNQIDEKSDTKGTFAGDTSIQSIEYRIRNLIHEGFPVGDPETDEFHFKFLNALGVEFNKSGLLSLKEDKFTKAMEDDFEGTAEAITGKFGFGNQMRSLIGTYARPGDGMLNMREQGFRNRIKRVDDDIADKERRVQQKAQNVTDQFARLQSTLSNMQRQQNYLTASLGGGGGGNMISQLLGG